MENKPDIGLQSAASNGDGSAFAGGRSSRSGCRRYVILAGFAAFAAGAVLAWWATRPVDTTPPEAVLIDAEPDKPLLPDNQRQVTFVLHDDKGGIPTFFLFEEENQKTTALGINALRGTPNERGVEVRFEAVRFRRDEGDPDKLWVRAVGIVNETEVKTPISLRELEQGEPLDLNFHDEVQVPYVAHVIYDVSMTIQYAPKTQRLVLSNASGSIRWKMLGSDAFDEGSLETSIQGQRGEYAEKPLLKF